MKIEKYRQLSDVHLLHRIWCNELELALQEVNFWEDLLDMLTNGLEMTGPKANTWKAEIDQLHHFRRLSIRLLEEIQSVNGQIAYGVDNGHGLNTESRLDHQYIREEMDCFHTGFKAFKAEIRQYLVALDESVD